MANDELRAEVNNNSRRAGPAWRQIQNACSCARAFQEQTLQSTPARVKRVFGGCLSSIILSPPNGNVKMSPYETGDIHVESERVAKSGRNQRVHQGRLDMCQSGGAARSYASAHQASQSPVSARQRSRSGTR